MFTDYGRSFTRWVLWGVLLAVVFGGIFAFHPEAFELGWHLEGERIVFNTEYQTMFTPFYFSLVTFTTLGFGDVTPVTLWAEIVVTVEVVLGYLFLGLLISIAGNKIAQRS